MTLKSYLPQMKCTECFKIMVPQFSKEYPHKLDGWSCDCGNSEKAILRERQYTREDDGNNQARVV
jgi:hypothetical protein